MAKTKPSRFRTIVQSLIPPILTNSMGQNMRGFPLFNRGNDVRYKDPEFLTFEDSDYYKDYLYAAIKNRANKTAKLAVNSIVTVVNDNTGEDEISEEPHPYLDVLDNSPTFSNFWFWKALSTYIDLKGLAYVLVRRNFNSTRFGAVQEFKVLNPYKVTRVISQSTGELGGYVESKGAQQRQIPPEQMIEIKELNPFDLDSGYPMVEAAKNNQYLSQSAGRWTRQAIKDNVGQRGLLTTEVVLGDEEYENFKSRVRSNSGSGDFLYANGPGAVSYIDMQIDMDKLALRDINEISREALFAVSGTSKTGLGIEMSGVTRDSSRVQKELNLEDHIEPQLQLIIDAFNQDYRNNYKTDYESSPLEIRIDSPSKIDKETEKADAEINKLKAESARLLVQAGYAPEAILEIVELEEMEHVGVPMPSFGEPEQNKVTDIVVNSLEDALKSIALAKESTLVTDINNFQQKVLAATVSKITPNQLDKDEQGKIITKKDRLSLEAELATILAAFYVSLIPLLAPAILRQRFKQYKLQATFTLDKETRQYIVERAGKTAASHMDTILEEIYNTAKGFTGLGRDQIVSQLTQLYNDKISKARATVIARTETNRTVAQAQFEADKQFIKQNQLESRAFKRWITRSSNPCSFCISMERQTASNPIPFGTPFIEMGDSISANFDTKSGSTTRTLVAGYEPIESGTMHPNCSCIYEIVIERG